MQRYGLYARRDHCEAWLSEECESDGEWVRFDEVKPLIEAVRQLQTRLDPVHLLSEGEREMRRIIDQALNSAV